jgi:hypothetical protein
LPKEDYLEDLQMLNNGGLVVEPSSKHPDGMNKSSVNESKGEDATALDVQTIERSNENFSLVSHLLIIACNHLKKFNDFVM